MRVSGKDGQEGRNFVDVLATPLSSEGLLKMIAGGLVGVSREQTNDAVASKKFEKVKLKSVDCGERRSTCVSTPSEEKIKHAGQFESKSEEVNELDVGG